MNSNIQYFWTSVNWYLFLLEMGQGLTFNFSAAYFPVPSPSPKEISTNLLRSKITVCCYFPEICRAEKHGEMGVTFWPFGWRATKFPQIMLYGHQLEIAAWEKKPLNVRGSLSLLPTTKGRLSRLDFLSESDSCPLKGLWVGSCPPPET